MTAAPWLFDADTIPEHPGSPYLFVHGFDFDTHILEIHEALSALDIDPATRVDIDAGVRMGRLSWTDRHGAQHELCSDDSWPPLNLVILSSGRLISDGPLAADHEREAGR